ncbi:MAG: hypothetical protein RBT62_03220 [Spirochaetia bacterium]|jgi:hypothetical protein|nr:hypothetical protein [Spirochaetia bacterium]
MIRVKTFPLAVIVIASMFGGIAIARAVGYYETTSSKQPAKFKTGELAGLPNPADIRGSYTWLDIEKAFGIPAADSAAAFSTPERRLDPSERVSVIEELYASILPPGLEIGTGAVRLFVSLYSGLPLEAEDGAVLPDRALALLATHLGVEPATLSIYTIPKLGSTNTVPKLAIQTVEAPATVTAGTAIAVAPSTPPPAPTAALTSPGSAGGMGTGTGEATGAGTGASSATARAVVGKTTFGDLYSWGLSPSQVEATTGFKPGPSSQSVREAATVAGIEFSSFKTALQSLVDATTP